MKTVTFQDILNQAAENAMRTRDKIPVSEQTMLKGFITTEFIMLLNFQVWPEYNKSATVAVALDGSGNSTKQFSKNEGAANEIGDVLAILRIDPTTTEYWKDVGFTEGDGVVYVDTNLTSLWVDYVLPYPGTVIADLSAMTLAQFFVATCPIRFRQVLAHKAAAHLLNADANAAAAGVQFGLAQAALTAEINRLPLPPEWRQPRAVKTGYGTHHYRSPVPPVCP